VSVRLRLKSYRDDDLRFAAWEAEGLVGIRSSFSSLAETSQGGRCNVRDHESRITDRLFGPRRTDGAGRIIEEGAIGRVTRVMARLWLLPQRARNVLYAVHGPVDYAADATRLYDAEKGKAVAAALGDLVGVALLTETAIAGYAKLAANRERDAEKHIAKTEVVHTIDDRLMAVRPLVPPAHLSARRTPPPLPDHSKDRVRIWENVGGYVVHVCTDDEKLDARAALCADAAATYAWAMELWRPGVTTAPPRTRGPSVARAEREDAELTLAREWSKAQGL
jgi:hypothetical protein